MKVGDMIRVSNMIRVHDKVCNFATKSATLSQSRRNGIWTLLGFHSCSVSYFVVCYFHLKIFNTTGCLTPMSGTLC